MKFVLLSTVFFVLSFAPRPSTSNRFTSDLRPVSYRDKRAANYLTHCRQSPPPIEDDVQRELRRRREVKKLNDEEAAINLYSAENPPLYKELNRGLNDDDEEILRKRGGLISKIRWAIKNRCKNKYAHLDTRVWGGWKLDKSSKKKHFINKKVPVYRGMKYLTCQHWREYYVGRKFIWSAFVSTTPNLEVAKGFCKDDGKSARGATIFKITFCSGCTYAYDVTRFSDFPEEQEILIYPGSGFEVVQEPRYDHRSGLMFVELKTIGTWTAEH